MKTKRCFTLVLGMAFLVWGVPKAFAPPVSQMNVGRPAVELPVSVPNRGAGLELYADFSNARTNGVGLYLINNTGKEIKLDSQDGDVYLKLEFKDDAGNWKRAQPHVFSWCGNSYDVKPVIKNGQFAEYQGYVPTSGRKATVRYRLCNQAVVAISNEGVGLVNDLEVIKADNDALRVADADLPTLAKIAKGELKLNNTMDHNKDLRGNALYALLNKKLDQRQARIILLEIANSEDAPYNSQAKGLLQRMLREQQRL